MNALRLAFGLLTVVPVRGLPDVDRRQAGLAILLAPLTTAPVLVLLVLAHLARSPVNGLPLAVLVVAAGALLTRVLHLDGLADTADGFSVNGDATRRLAAMKASDTGPSGVVALVLVLLLQVACLWPLIYSGHGTLLAAVAWVASRHALAWACRTSVPSASTGLGSLVAGTVGRTGLAVATVLVVVLSAVASLPEWWVGPLAVLLALAAAGVVVRRATVLLGGITGDVLGAAVEVALAAGLLAAVVLL